MDQILELLNNKNFHLNKFLEMNDKELSNFVEGNFDNLERFYQTREAILDLIKCIDRLVEQGNIAITDARTVTEQQRLMLKKVLDEKNEIVTRILAQDLQILSVLETAKSNIIRELAQVKVARKAVGAYHSGHTEPRLDEEA